MGIVFITSAFPFPATAGWAIKTLSLIDYLRQRHQLRVICFRRSQLSLQQEQWAGEHAVESLQLSRGRTPANLLRSYVRGLPMSIERNRSREMAALVDDRIRRESPAAVFVDGWLMAQYLPPRYAGLKLLHEHNAEHVLWQRQRSIEKNPVPRLLVGIEYRRVRAYEASILQRFDRIFAVSEDDRRALLDLAAPPDVLRVLPNLPDQSLLDLPPLSFQETEPAVFHLGTLSWQPNIEGVEYLLTSVFPLVREQAPEARLVIAGRDAPARLERLARRTRGADLIGSIVDPEPLYRKARVFVDTTRSGGGTKLKVLNALARGLPVVATPQSAQGIGAVHGEHLLVCEDPTALAGAVFRLLSDEQLWQRLSEEGRKLVRSRFVPDLAYAPLEEALSGAAS